MMLILTGCNPAKCVDTKPFIPGGLENRRESRSFPIAAFTLIEILTVMAVVIVIFALVAPAVTGVGRAGDITKASYDVSGVLQMARSYATANGTYVWVGFFEEDGTRSSTTPATPGTGRIVISTVASKDGTNIFATGAPVSVQPLQVNKLVKIPNMHLRTAKAGDPVFPLGVPNGANTTFDTRPAVSGTNAQIGDISPGAIAAQYQIHYPAGGGLSQYTFTKVIQFNPRGEVSVNNNPLTPVVEVGLQPTHGAVLDNGKNVAAVQITGVGGNVTIYRR